MDYDTIMSLIERGLAKRVTSLSELDDYNYNGVPPRKCEWSIFNNGSSMDILIPLNLFQKHIEILLSKINCVRYNWNNNRCVWEIEYGTIPIEKNKPIMEYNQIMRGKHAAICAAGLALEKFPYLINHDKNFENNFINYMDIKKWSKMELRIYNDIEKNCLFINLNRMTGDRASYFYIWDEIYRYFDNNIFLSRISFLELVEGTTYDNSNYIQRYLFDDLLVKEFCTFMQYN